ncbi:hypothetical protein LTR62_001835 [Meristemomyces frigidus]|uniref:C2H2-type domain-containing protein n=1 Tax=Meristemomyces frigidus TaxID=1508187 RepID=A0AAN7TH78_9PEZI|nr:hypothetical protein LTR62_001835 [Meristemomyces frigidus]
MVPAPNPMSGADSFASRRPNASYLPSFELPPPQLASYQSKYPSSTSLPAPTTLASAGNLLTPPSNSTDGISPVSGMTAASSASSHGAVQSYQSGIGSMWPPPSTSGASSYAYAPAPPQFSQGRSLFSPSLNSIVRATHSPTAGDSLPPPPYELPYQTTMSMSAPGQTQYSTSMMSAPSSISASVTQASPVHRQEAFAPLPTPTYYQSSQHSGTAQQATFPYSSGPSPIQQSPISAGSSMPRMSPITGNGSMAPLAPPPQYSQHPRPYSYPPSGGPVLSNIGNPNGQLSLVGGMSHGMMSSYNSGHAASMHHMYPPQQNAQNDRPFRCDQCPQSFNRNHDLKRHKRIHLAVKPFPCGHCDKSFSRKDALKRHVLVKGCGKAHAITDVKEIDPSLSPKSESSSSRSPVVRAETR